MFVFKFTDSVEAPFSADYTPPLAYESCHPTQQEAEDWQAKIAAAYTSWAVEAAREEPDDYELIQVRRQRGAV